jgi:hypothetical protein
MTEITSRTRASLVAQISLWVRRCQRDLSDRVHAAGDERARHYGWEVMESTGRFGCGARTYRDPRFTTGAGNTPRPGSLSAKPRVPE